MWSFQAILELNPVNSKSKKVNDVDNLLTRLRKKQGRKKKERGTIIKEKGERWERQLGEEKGRGERKSLGKVFFLSLLFTTEM